MTEPTPSVDRDRRAMAERVQPGSSSLEHPDYWWYRARAELLDIVFRPLLGQPRRTLDVGSADAPSVGWIRGQHHHVALDLFAAGLVPGQGVRASATALPFADETFDVVSAFDVVEHCADDEGVVAELARVLMPGGRLLLSVPAYQWAWSDHDVRAGHHRRYTQGELTRLVAGAGLSVTRSTYVFAAVFPLFAAERLLRRLGARWSGRAPRAKTSLGAGKRLPPVSQTLERVLMCLLWLDRRVLRTCDLPFGSSCLVAGTKHRVVPQRP